MLLYQLEQHVGKAEDRIGRQAADIAQSWDREEGAENIRAAIDEE
jgi:hypothetical protein